MVDPKRHHAEKVTYVTWGVGVDSKSWFWVKKNYVEKKRAQISRVVTMGANYLGLGFLGLHGKPRTLLGPLKYYLCVCACVCIYVCAFGSHASLCKVSVIVVVVVVVVVVDVVVGVRKCLPLPCTDCAQTLPGWNGFMLCVSVCEGICMLGLCDI